MKKEDDFKTLSSALDEVHRKGILIERLTLLENRVLQLSLEMEAVGNTSGSSSEKERSRTRGRRWFRMGC
ncbi:hypothetical protein LWI29_002364 [Acer saccharum]|uniref:Uncharacterized protein n=1 Tax=Acer saccharum TaxID=4024 RepID=A0AA39TCV9_ACESA|nr:hypothetical protein LWI29_002364 [Acer saccharum]